MRLPLFKTSDEWSTSSDAATRFPSLLATGTCFFILILLQCNLPVTGTKWWGWYDWRIQYLRNFAIISRTAQEGSTPWKASRVERWVVTTVSSYKHRESPEWKGEEERILCQPLSETMKNILQRAESYRENIGLSSALGVTRGWRRSSRAIKKSVQTGRYWTLET